MNFCVVKTGFTLFDALHAYGVASVLTLITDKSVELYDEGVSYHLQCSRQSHLHTHKRIFDQLFALPTRDMLQALGGNLREVNILVSRLDGLLAYLFTSPGPRLVSVIDLVVKQRLNTTVVDAGLRKAQSTVERLMQTIQRHVHDSNDLVALLRADYDAHHPVFTQIGVKRRGDTGITMMLDPGLSYASRRPWSDGLITDKVNVALYQPRLGTELAIIGAMHFLRAQRVAGRYVNVYIPLATAITLEPEMALPLLPGADVAADHALIRHCLTLYQQLLPSGTHWSGLGYHTLHTQGAQQSISFDRGILDMTWLTKLEQRTRGGVLDRWRRMLRYAQDHRPFDSDALITSLLRRSSTSWVIHLQDVARYSYHHPEVYDLLYTLREIQEMSCMMLPGPPQPLYTILERKEGAVRFGHAARLLGRANPSALRDLIDALDTVQSRDDLFDALARMLQACVLAEAKSPFIIVPNDNDFTILLRDSEHYGAHTIAGVLIILSMLRYPLLETQRSEGQQQDETEHLPPNRSATEV